MATRKLKESKKSAGRQRKKDTRASTNQKTTRDPGQDKNELNRDAVVRGSIHASPRAWLELISSRPLDQCSLERLDTQGSLINQRPDALYRVRDADREWIYCVEAQWGSQRELGRRFLIALVMLLTEAGSTNSRSTLVPLEVRTKERSRTLNPGITYQWGLQDLTLSWFCSNALLESNGKVEELPLTLDTVTIHAWHVATTKECLERLCDWTETQDVDADEKSLILCLLRLTGRVRFGADMRRVSIIHENAAMNQAKIDKRADESVFDYLVRELEMQALEREDERRQEGRQEGREDERATLLSLAEQLLPDQIDALRALDDLEELRAALNVAVAELAATIKEYRSGDA